MQDSTARGFRCSAGASAGAAESEGVLFGGVSIVEEGVKSLANEDRDRSQSSSKTLYGLCLPYQRH